MREVTLLVRHHGEPESDISEKYPRITLQSMSSMTGSASERKRIIKITGPSESIAGFLKDFRAAEPVIATEPLSSLESSQVFVAIRYDNHQWDSISQRLTDMGIHYRTGTTITAGWERWTLYLNDTTDLGKIIASIERAGNDTNLVRDISLDGIEKSPQLEISRVLYDELTPRQREVLATAITLGYYQLKKSASIEDISNKLGIAPTTAWEHLARAERKIMCEIAPHLTSDATR